MSTDPCDAITRAATCAAGRRGPFPLVIGCAAALVLVALAAPMAHGQSRYGEPKEVSLDELKRVYLACSHAALSGRLSTGGIMKCSVVYEEFKRRAFGGDFHKLLAWSRAQPFARRVEP